MFVGQVLYRLTSTEYMGNRTPRRLFLLHLYNQQVRHHLPHIGLHKFSLCRLEYLQILYLLVPQTPSVDLGADCSTLVLLVQLGLTTAQLPAPRLVLADSVCVLGGTTGHIVPMDVTVRYATLGACISRRTSVI